MIGRVATIGVGVFVAGAFATGVAGAQSTRLADSLLRRGLLDRAESEYYTAVRVQPRDPQARWALGRYLAARGALRIGATLIDEAMQFGYDKHLAGTALAKIYMDLGEYKSVASLAVSPLSSGQKALVHWLVDHPSRPVAPDSTVLVAFSRSTVDGYVGSTRIRINGQPIFALIAPRSGCGIRLSDTTSVATKLHRFPADSSGAGKVTPAAADSIGYGRMTVTNVPVSIETVRESAQAIICLGALMRYAPTFDARGGLITLRLGGKAPAARASSSGYAFLDVDGQFSIARAGGWTPIIAPQVASTLRDRRWTLDARRGQLVVEP